MIPGFPDVFYTAVFTLEKEFCVFCMSNAGIILLYLWL